MSNKADGGAPEPSAAAEDDETCGQDRSATSPREATSINDGLSGLLLQRYAGRRTAYGRKLTDGRWEAPVRENGQDILLTPEVVSHYLASGEVIGVYPLDAESDEVGFAVLDFDDHEGLLTWEKVTSKAAPVVEELRRRGCHAFPTRSSGGRGLHLALFWDKRQSAAAVRALLIEVLAACGLQEGSEGGIAAGVVEIFPKQDRVRASAYGNLVALPIAGESAPLDDGLNPLPMDDLADRLALTMTSAPVPTIEPSPMAPPRGDVGTELVLEGGRNIWLTREAGKLRRMGFGGSEFRASLLTLNRRCNPPLDEKEVMRIARSVERYDVGEVHLPLTDVGNGARLVAISGGDLIYCYPWNGWLIWDGQRWQRDQQGEVIRRAKEAAAAIYDEAAAASASDPKRADAIAKWASRSQQRPRLEAMAWAAQSELPVSPNELDQHTELLNLENGTLDLATLNLREYRRGDQLTRLAGTNLDPEAKCPLFLDFLNTVFEGNEELMAYVQRAVGYSLTGEVGEHCFFLCHGTGANGKSTFLETISAMLGDYARPTEFRTLLHRENSEAVRNDLAGLFGVRLVTAVEVGEGRRFDEALIKQLTGGDTITARFLYREYFDFQPQFKLWLAANDKPQIRGVDEAIWRRVHVIPFEVTIPPEDRDKDLPNKLGAELPGILKWAVEGLRAWRDRGLDPPEAVLAATEEYRAEMDLLADFLKSRCELGDGKSCPAGKLYNAYQDWCEDNGEKPVQQRTFGTMMRQRGFKAKVVRPPVQPKVGGGQEKKGAPERTYHGIGLLSPVVEDEYEVPF